MNGESGTWSVAKAKAHLSELIHQAVNNGPQTITRNGRDVVVIVSSQEWERKTKRTGNLAEFLTASPLREIDLDIERTKDEPRTIDL